jgi:type IV secretory pathway TraG/TraD family ATPase VirD4
MLTKEIDEFKARMEEQGRKIMTPLYYNTFLIAPEKTMNTILITTAVDLQLFANPDVDRLTRYNKMHKDLNINLDDLVQTETYLFLSIPQDNKAYNFLISMIYSQLFSRTYALGEYITANKWLVCKYQGYPLLNCIDTEGKGIPVFESEEEANAIGDNISESNIIRFPYINGTKIYYLVWNNKILKKSFSKEAMENLVHDLQAHKYKVYNSNQRWSAPALPMRVEFMLDEFKNIGKIPNFDTIIATCRKYRIGVHVVIQDIAQLKELYPNESHQTILANTDITLFLGSKLPEDVEYIQKMAGKTTILQRSTSGGSGKGSGSISWTPTQVDLLSLDEVKAINKDNRHQKAIVLIRDMVTFVDDKLDFRKHPNYNLLQEAQKKISLTKYFENDRESKII